MAGRIRTIVHKTLKKPDGSPIQMAWDEDAENEDGGAGRTFRQYVTAMDIKFPGGFDEMPEEDSPSEKQRKYIRTRMDQIPDGPEKDLFLVLLKDMLGQS